MKKPVKEIKIQNSWLRHWFMWSSIELRWSSGSLENAMNRIRASRELEDTAELRELKIQTDILFSQLQELREKLKSVRNSLPEN